MARFEQQAGAGGVATELDPLASARLDALDLTFSTDAERAAAVAALQATDAATNSRIDALDLTFSTDAERNAAVAALQAADALKQNAATAATDDELAALKAASKGVVVHAADANVARPAGFGSVEWVGSVAPANAVDGDTWVNTA